MRASLARDQNVLIDFSALQQACQGILLIPSLCLCLPQCYIKACSVLSTVCFSLLLVQQSLDQLDHRFGKVFLLKHLIPNLPICLLQPCHTRCWRMSYRAFVLMSWVAVGDQQN